MRFSRRWTGIVNSSVGMPSRIDEKMNTSRQRIISREHRGLLLGLLFISPWIIGFFLFLVYPVLSNFYLGMTRYSGFGEPEWTGFRNYQQLVRDRLVWSSLYNPFYYVTLAVPLGVFVAIALALAMNQKVREVTLYRVLLYLPSVAPVFALSMMLIWLLNPRFGLFNYLLGIFHVPSINWLGDTHWSKLAIVLVAQFGAGQIALIFLAALKAIPSTLYDAASLDGAGPWRKFWYITLPLLTPTILYDIIIGIGLGLQIFAPAYIMTGGGIAFNAARKM